MIYDWAHMHEEVLFARKKLRERAMGVREIVEQMAMGLSLSGRGRDVEVVRNIENHYHEYVAQILPRIAGGQPKVTVETGRAGPGRLEAAAGEAAVNQWIEDTRHFELLRRVGTDYLLGWGVAGLRMDRLPAQETDDYHTVPVAFRIEREDAFWDPIATEWETRQYAGWQWTIGLDDLIEKAEQEEGWDLEAVRSLATDVEDDEAPSRRPGDAPPRREVVVREVWCPRVLNDKAPRWATGTIYTLGVGAKGFLREPRPFFGPPWGPVYLYDAYYVPGEPLGAGPCELVREQVEELNRHANALSESAKRRRKILLGSMFNAEDAKAVFEARDGSMVMLDGFETKRFEAVEWDGITQEQLAAIQVMRDRVQRGSGLDDALRGAVTGTGTATETAIAAESAGVRVSHMADRFAGCDEMLLSGVLWYVLHARSLRVRLRPEAAGIPPEIAKQTEVVVRGGMRPGMNWHDFRLRVQRRTMARESDAARQARLGRAVATTLSIAQIAPQIAPYTDVRRLLEMAGQAEGVEELEMIVSPDAAAALFGAQAAPPTGEPAEAEVAPAEPTARPAIVPGRRREAGTAGAPMGAPKGYAA